MREVRLRVPHRALEDVLDRLLPIVPGGVREHTVGAEVELRMRGAGVPPLEALARAAGRWSTTLCEHEVSDDWRTRRLAEYRADPIGGRLVVRPEWAPAPESGLIDIVIAEGVAFGGGTHPTTRACLEVLLREHADGAFADLGCGTGVIAILAAKLGWTPVNAIDVQPDSVAAASANAERNSIDIACTIADLGSDAPPPADGFAANVPAALHAVIAAQLPEPLARFGLLSGFSPADSADVIAAYRARGLRLEREIVRDGWVVAQLGRD